MSEENMNETEGTAPVEGRAAGEAQAVKTVRGKNYLLDAQERDIASASATWTVPNGTITHRVRVKGGAVHFKSLAPSYRTSGRLVSYSRPLMRGVVHNLDDSFTQLFSTFYLVDGNVPITPGRRYVWKTEPGKTAYLGVPLPATGEGEPLGVMLWTFNPKDSTSAFHMEFDATCNVCRTDYGKVISR